MAGRHMEVKETLSRIEPRQGSRVQSLDRALDILESLAAVGGEISLSDLAERVGLHVSTVHRLLFVLVSRGYARQNGPSGRYALGPHLLKLASSAVGIGQFDLRHEARTVLQELGDNTGETTNLVVLIDQQVVYVDQVASRHTVRMFTQIGTRAPIYCTGVGKVVLAFRGASEVEAYLRQERFEPRTPTTINSTAALRDELRCIRERGYAYDNGEMESDVHCVAAPVFDHTTTAVAAISVSGPAMRFDRDRMEQVVPALLRAASELSSRLGYRPRIVEQPS
ncbi:MAG TPA: IclR family transcriptional regulator [Ktedonobacterales bacterium]|nr:IclR family transcriptional regulator [Ktedonobacterales bacterium]